MLETLLELLLALGEEVECAPGAPICRDPNDNVYLWTCQAGSVVVLLTGDEDLLSLSAETLQIIGLSGLKIMKPREFLSCYYE